MKEVLIVENLCKDKLLKNINFTISKGEMVAIMGPSGSGKSTLLYQVSGMDTFNDGKVTLCGQELNHLSEDGKATLRLEKVGFVFQQMQMLKNKTILDNITLPALQLYGKKRRTEIVERAVFLLRSMNLEHLKERDIVSVSGGQLQRACICRCLINHPEIVFADEPTGALNRSSEQDVLDVFQDLNQKGLTVLMVTHDSKVAATCNRVLYLIDGKIEGILDLLEGAEPSEREEALLQWLSRMGW